MSSSTRRLPEPCELRPPCPHHQTGDAGGAGGCEHGVEHVQPSRACWQWAKVSSSVPSAITIIKLTQMIWVGVLSPSFLRRTDLWCRSFLRIFFIFSIASSLRSTQPLAFPYSIHHFARRFNLILQPGCGIIIRYCVFGGFSVAPRMQTHVSVAQLDRASAS